MTWDSNRHRGIASGSIGEIATKTRRPFALMCNSPAPRRGQVLHRFRSPITAAIQFVVMFFWIFQPLPSARAGQYLLMDQDLETGEMVWGWTESSYIGMWNTWFPMYMAAWEDFEAMGLDPQDPSSGWSFPEWDDWYLNNLIPIPGHPNDPETDANNNGVPDVAEVEQWWPGGIFLVDGVLVSTPGYFLSYGETDPDWDPVMAFPTRLTFIRMIQAITAFFGAAAHSLWKGSRFFSRPKTMRATCMIRMGMAFPTGF